MAMNYNKAFNAVLAQLSPAKIEEILPPIILADVQDEILKTCSTESFKQPDVTFMLSMLEDDCYNYATTLKNLKMFDKGYGLKDFGGEFFDRLAESLVKKHKIYIDNMPAN